MNGGSHDASPMSPGAASTGSENQQGNLLVYSPSCLCIIIGMGMEWCLFSLAYSSLLCPSNIIVRRLLIT